MVPFLVLFHLPQLHSKHAWFTQFYPVFFYFTSDTHPLLLPMVITFWHILTLLVTGPTEKRHELFGIGCKVPFLHIAWFKKGRTVPCWSYGMFYPTPQTPKQVFWLNWMDWLNAEHLFFVLLKPVVLSSCEKVRRMGYSCHCIGWSTSLAGYKQLQQWN